MNDEFVGFQVGGELAAFGPRKFQLAAHAALQKARNLDAADVVLNWMVRAGLGNQDAVARLERVDHRRGAGLFHKVALEPRE